MQRHIICGVNSINFLKITKFSGFSCAWYDRFENGGGGGEGDGRAGTEQEKANGNFDTIEWELNEIYGNKLVIHKSL